MTRLTITLSAIHFLCTIALAQTCPKCYTAQTFGPLPGRHGASSDGRRIVNVCFDASAQVDDTLQTFTPGITNTKLWNAVVGYWDSQSQYHQGAIDFWNNATDQNGNHSGYFFQFTSDCSSADIYVATETSGQIGGLDCAQSDPVLDSDTKQEIYGYIEVSEYELESVNQTDIVQGISHEFGHFLGLVACRKENVTNVAGGI